jgi:hypothetical protein
MDTIKKSRLQVRVAALLVFMLGLAAGALAFSAYQRWSAPRPRNFEEVLIRLQLTDDQKNQVHQIFGETREKLQAVRRESEPKVQEIRRQTDERLQKVMTAEQWKQFQGMRDEMRSRRRGRGPGGR